MEFLDHLDERVLQHVSEATIVEIASQLVRFPSFTTEETGVSAWLAEFLRGRGYQVNVQEVEAGRKQTIARLPGNGRGRTLMFNGHLDIDPLRYGWKRDPWTPAVESGRLYGAGLGNMKGGVASMIAATEALRLSGVERKGDIVLACVIGELQGGIGTVHLLNGGIRGDLAIVPEPCGANSVITGHAGWMQLAVSIIGFSQQMAMRHSAVDAIQKMVSVIATLERVQFRYSPAPNLPGLPFLHVGCIIGGRGETHDLRAPNFVSDHCTILIDVRYVPGQTPQTVCEDVERVLAGMKQSDPALEYRIEHPPARQYRAMRLDMTPFEIDVNSEIVQLVVKQYRKLTKRLPDPLGMQLPYACTGNDNCHLAQAGIPSVIYGPRSIPPTQNEPEDCIAIEELLLATRVMALAALAVSQTDSGL